MCLLNLAWGLDRGILFTKSRFYLTLYGPESGERSRASEPLVNDSIPNYNRSGYEILSTYLQVCVSLICHLRIIRWLSTLVPIQTLPLVFCFNFYRSHLEKQVDAIWSMTYYFITIFYQFYKRPGKIGVFYRSLEWCAPQCWS